MIAPKGSKQLKTKGSKLYTFWCSCTVRIEAKQLLPHNIKACPHHGANVKSVLLKCTNCGNIVLNPNRSQKYCTTKWCVEDRKLERRAKNMRVSPGSRPVKPGTLLVAKDVEIVVVKPDGRYILSNETEVEPI